MTKSLPTISDLIEILESGSIEKIAPLLPDGEQVPAHFHVTEIARFQKDFIDCGGTVRQSRYAQIQILTATDFAHRLSAKKLLGILRASAGILGDEELPLVAEYGPKTAVSYPVSALEVVDGVLTLRMETPSTACLAPDTCGLDRDEAKVDLFRVPSCSPESGCC